MTMPEHVDGTEDEGEPALKLNMTDGTMLVARRGSTRLFTFWGLMEKYDHVYVANNVQAGPPEDDDPEEYGHYVFRDNELFNALKKLVMENSFPQILNSLYPMPEDIEEYDRQHLQSVGAAIDAMFDGQDFSL